MRFKTLFVVAVSVGLLGACGETGKFYEAGSWNTSNYTDNWDVKGAKNMESVGSPFQKALHKEYVALAAEELAESDLNDSGLFLNKARASARGESLGPQRVPMRNLTDGQAQTLSDARARLVDAILMGRADVHTPKHAARAQAMFDCWMEELEENIQPNDISKCQKGFEAAMAKLKTAKIAMPAPPPAPMPAPAPMAKEMPKPYVVYFGFDRAHLTSEARATIKQAAADYGKFKPSKIVISGHTDRSGANPYNVSLSKRRVSAVADALVSSGVPSARISQSHHGEDRPMVSTADGQREAQNRRVEIDYQN
jgi:outer membrane protein OmpA-like peptidoglycan-associated protein